MGTSLSWPCMREGQVEVKWQSLFTFTPQYPRQESGDKESQERGEHFVLPTIISIHPRPGGLCLAPLRTAENGKGCVRARSCREQQMRTQTK